MTFSEYYSDPELQLGPPYRGDLESGGEFSGDGRYRYRLWRYWDWNLPSVVWVMLNPSTADAQHDDATLRRCRRFARDWGYGGLEVVNLCAFVSTDPKTLHRLPLATVTDEAPGRNDRAIRQAVHAGDDRGRLIGGGHDLVVCAWGANVGKHAGLQIRASQVLLLLNELGVQPHYLRRTKGGQPEHPLRLPAALKPKPWRTSLTVPSLSDTL